MSVPPGKPTYSICQSQQQTSEPYNLDYYRNYSGTLKAGPPRQEDVKETFPNSEKDLHKLLWKKHDDFLKNGYSSLIGKIATERALSILRDNKDEPKFEALFQRGSFSITIGLNQFRNDIIARTNEGIPSYNDIINEMKQSGEANLTVAHQILANLSKNYTSNDPYEIFKDLPDSAKKLMALLICETIRFQEDGACARMAMRMVINEYENESNQNFSEPFEHVFVTENGEDYLPTPYSIFAISPGGTSRMRSQFYSAPKWGNSDFANDEGILKNKIDNISDDKTPQTQSNSNFNTANETSYYAVSAPYGTHPMLTQGRIRINKQLKEPSSESSNNPTPIRTTSFLVKQSGPQLSLEDQETTNFPPPFTSNSPGDTENDNYREEEAQHEFEENQARSSDHEVEHNDSMGPSTTVNNDFEEVNQETAATQAFIRDGDFHFSDEE